MHRTMGRMVVLYTSTKLNSLCGLCLVFCALLLWLSQINTVIRNQHVGVKTFTTNTETSKCNTTCFPKRDFSCEKLIAGDPIAINETTKYMKENFRTSMLEETYPTLTKDCQKYRRGRNYINFTMSDGERQFPIAFSLLVYKHVEQVERLLRAIWRSHNVYCIHVDAKSTNTFKEAVKSISTCFDNIILLPRPVSVYWGTFTVLEPELLCMDALWRHNTTWKYFINLTGQEFPLKTNYELYLILESYRGANDIRGTYKRAMFQRWKGRGTVPHNIQPRVGNVHIAASRGYVDYLLHNKVALDLLTWVKNTSIPDETYFSTLNYNPHLKVPGSYKGDVDDGLDVQWARYKIWADATQCAGMFTRLVCIFSVGDLKRLTSAPHMFANKFFYEYHHLAYDCLESWYYGKIESEKKGKLDFNTTVYKNRRTVSNHF